MKTWQEIVTESKVSKNQWIKFLKDHFRVKLSPEELEMIERFEETDGGKSTQDFDKPNEDNYVFIAQGSSKTYWGILKKGFTPDDYQSL